MQKREFGMMIQGLVGRYPKWQHPTNMEDFAGSAWESLQKYPDAHLIRAFKFSAENHEQFPTLSKLLDAISITREPARPTAPTLPEGYEPITAEENARRISLLVAIFDGKRVEPEPWMDERLVNCTPVDDMSSNKPYSDDKFECTIPLGEAEFMERIHPLAMEIVKKRP